MVGGGVSEGSASGFGVGVGVGEGVSFFFDFFFGSDSSSDFRSTNIRRWSVLPVCRGITTVSYCFRSRDLFFFLEDVGFDGWKSDSQPAPPNAKHRMAKIAKKRWCIWTMVPPPVRESGTESLGKNNRTRRGDFQERAQAPAPIPAKCLPLKPEPEALLCASLCPAPP